jgi:hypothetical protein
MAPHYLIILKWIYMRSNGTICIIAADMLGGERFSKIHILIQYYKIYEMRHSTVLSSEWNFVF